MLCFLFSYSPS